MPANRVAEGRAAAGPRRLLGLELRATGARRSIRKGCRRGGGSSTTRKLFDTVEVNTTFYRLPSRDAVANWAAQTPPDFVFTVKASRYLTHIKRLTKLGHGVERFYERIEPLIEAGKLGPVLWQLPGTSSATSSGCAQRWTSFPPGVMLRVPPPELVQRRRL